jgi:glycosyltransferase involved in cell wall biosynthesis
MLVSATVDSRLRRDVESGRRPVPEFLRLSDNFGVELVDWSHLGLKSGHRSVRRSMHHVAAALGRVRDYDAVFCDGEHVGIPLALAMRALRIHTPHLVLGHNLLTRAKTKVFESTHPERRIDRLLVHSENQVAPIVRHLGIAPSMVQVVPFGVDSAFWSANDDQEDDGLIVSAGREHRDYVTLIAARPPGTRLVVADHSVFTPEAQRRSPIEWPRDVERLALDAAGLRSLYSRASVVVVPLIESRFPAGITTVLEAMSMGKAVVVTETEAIRGVVEHGRTGLTVPCHDPHALRAAIEELCASPRRRREMGAAARAAVLERYDVDLYAATLASHLGDLITAAPIASSYNSSKRSAARAHV